MSGVIEVTTLDILEMSLECVSQEHRSDAPVFVAGNVWPDGLIDSLGFDALLERFTTEVQSGLDSLNETHGLSIGWGDGDFALDYFGSRSQPWPSDMPGRIAVLIHWHVGESTIGTYHMLPDWQVESMSG